MLTAAEMSVPSSSVTLSTLSTGPRMQILSAYGVLTVTGRLASQRSTHCSSSSRADEMRMPRRLSSDESS